jgi:diguanylate cyclase (GGDEF)-like protein
MRKRDAEKLKLAHNDLEDKVKERTKKLEETIKKRQSIEQKLVYDSLHDSLTGLPNRVYLLQELDKLLMNQGAHALLFLDLDRFKIINDSLGHHIGDLFLIQISQSIKECVRGNDLVARLGGDEFCVLMPNVDDNSVALQICNRILKALRKPVEVNSHSLLTSASIGVRLISEDDESADMIMSDADMAMYKAKNEGKNGYCFFNRDIKRLLTKRMSMENDLHRAVEKKEFFLEYQPVVSCLNEQVIGFEALIRWQHPESGLISPFEFIPVAEETGLIVEIGEQVITMACETLKSFQSNPYLADLYVNINASSVQILSRTLDDFIRRQLQSYAISSSLFNVEITESILIEDYKAALNFVRELRAMGIKIYLDDFGTGFSSLSYLHKFPFDVIKLDRSFISDLDGSKKNKALVESTAMLARNLEIGIVAEGVETKEQSEMIRAMGFDMIQGYYYSKPLRIDKVEAFVKKQNS